MGVNVVYNSIKAASAATYYFDLNKTIEKHLGTLDRIVHIFYFVFSFTIGFIPLISIILGQFHYRNKVTSVQSMATILTIVSITNYLVLIAIPFLLFQNIIFIAMYFLIFGFLFLDTTHRNQQTFLTHLRSVESVIDKRIDEIIELNYPAKVQRVKVEANMVLKRCVVAMQKKNSSLTTLIAYLFLFTKAFNDKVDLSILDGETIQTLDIISHR